MTAFNFQMIKLQAYLTKDFNKVAAVEDYPDY